VAEPSTATPHNVTLFDEHEQAVLEAAKLRGIANRKRYFSPALQFLIEDWKRLRDLEQKYQALVSNLAS
jgi:hypothetical protein